MTAPVPRLPKLDALSTPVARSKLGYFTEVQPDAHPSSARPHHRCFFASLLLAVVFGSVTLQAAAPQTIVVNSATEAALMTAISAAQNGDTVAFAANLFTGTTPT